jgi:hypothetical protein
VKKLNSIPREVRSLGRPPERENKLRLGFLRIIRLKENAPELDYSSFYGKTGAGETRSFVVEV